MSVILMAMIAAVVSLSISAGSARAIPSPCKTWTGNVGTSWANGNNWSPTVAPSNSDSCITIPTGTPNNPRISTGVGVFSPPVTIDSGATLTIAASGTFSPSGLLKIDGTFTQNTGTFNPSGSIAINGTATTTSDMTVATGKTLTVNGTYDQKGVVTVNGTYSQIGGTVTATRLLDVTNTGSFTQSAGTYAAINDIFSIDSGTNTQTGGTINVNIFRLNASGASFIQDESSGTSVIRVGQNFNCKTGTTFTSTAGTVEKLGTTAGGVGDAYQGTCSFHSLKIANTTGMMKLTTGTVTADTLRFGDDYQVAGTWGSTASSADNQDDTYFNVAGTGIMTVATWPALETAKDAVELAESTQSQTDVDAAQLLVTALPDGTDKTALQERLDAVQEAIDDLAEATAAVELAEGTESQTDLDAAQTLVTALPDGTDKTALQDRLDALQVVIDTNRLDEATAAVVNAEGTKLQADVDAAQALVTALKNGGDKTALQSRLDAIQVIIDEAKSGQPVNNGPTPDKFKTDIIAEFITVTGTPTSATKATFNVDYTINSGDDKVVFPAGTDMTKTDGSKMNFTELDFEDIAESLRSAAVGEVAGAVSLGIPGLNLSFSKPISITINVGSSYNGQTLNVYFQNEGQADWSDGLSCVVTNSLCTFQTDHATDYSAGDDLSDDHGNKAKISSWDIEKYYDLTKDQKLRVKIEIKGKRFAKKAEVRIGGKKADRVERKSSKKIVAWFDWKDLNGKYDKDRKVTVTNPGADSAKADKAVDIKEIEWDLSSSQFDPSSTEGVKNIQKALFNLGYLSEDNITGLKGPNTIDAVKKFQADNGIPQTGHVGPLTSAKLTELAK